MPGAEAMPAWALGGMDTDTEDLAAWLRDTGGDGSLGGFSSDIDASWLGAVPAADDVTGAADLGGVDVPVVEDGPTAAGA